MWWAFDCECERWSTLAFAAAVASDGTVVRMRTAEDVRRWFRELSADDVVWSHCGGGFDFLLLIGLFETAQWTGRCAGGSLIQARPRGGPDCRDSFALFPFPLAEWAGKEALDLPCSCGLECGGYCSIRAEGMPRAHRRRLEEYCVSDCRALLEALTRDVAQLEADGFAVMYQGKPRLSLGSIAWRTAAAMARVPNKPIEWADIDAGLRCYYGGRCEVFRVRADAGHHYDLRAAYPWALTFPVPCGRRRALGAAQAARAYRAGKPGSYRAVVMLEESAIPQLPHRVRVREKGRAERGRLVWSCGHLDGWWTGYELRAAEERGARVLRVLGAHVWSDEEPLYRPYIDRVWALRDAAERRGDDRWARVLKQAANSLSGKLAQGADADVVRVQARGEPPPRGWYWHGGRVFSYRLRARPASARPIEAATITARVRIEVYDRLERNADGAIYCDTDSTFLLQRDDRGTGSGLGEWKDKGPITEWLALAPKLMRYRDAEGREEVRARGIPRATWEMLDDLARGVAVTSEGVARLRSSGGRLTAAHVTRSWRDAGSDWCGMRRVLADGTTRPLWRARDGSYT